ncbi:S-methyl-5-thioribose-1-phosphate isomerase, partial [Candidatus Bathyarchaeota archaeon]|nr:S-methyl-5-thioribose-1-phosphate isomerase [Candidatus Bathyarchaeota archaeon]
MRTIEWRNGLVVTIDQLKLPNKVEFLEMKSCEDVAEAIKTMRIRGAPLLGAAAAYALALVAYHSKAESREMLLKELEEAAKTIKGTRPTAVNLFWAIDRILNKVRSCDGSVDELRELVIDEANRIADEDTEA